MNRRILLPILLFALIANVPAFAATPQQKMATCKFGADSQKLSGSARAKFLKNCMANRNDPRGTAAQGEPSGETPPQR